MESLSVELVPIDETVLRYLLDVAVRESDPREAMAPVDGLPGWNDVRRQAFVAYHRRVGAINFARPSAETTYAVRAADQIVGALRLATISEDPGALEVGLWLGKARRGCGLGGQALNAAVDLVRQMGVQRLIARTTGANNAAMAALATRGLSSSSPTTSSKHHWC